MSKRLFLLKASILILSVWSVVAVAGLSIREFTGESVCIKLGAVPLCYLILLCCIMMVISQLRRSNSSKMIFWIGLMVPWSISLITSINELNSIFPCPHQRFGIPSCYLGFLLFSSIMLLNRIKKNFFPNDGVEIINLFGKK